MPQHFVTTRDLADHVIHEILTEAWSIVPTLGLRHDRTEILAGRNIALAFFEPSTRTRISFETAAHRLGAAAVVFQPQGSSIEKGESLWETLATIEAMCFDAIVLRHADDGVMLQATKRCNITIINGGEGTQSHPTQALLDASTVMERYGSLHGIRIVLVGDVQHSRVARSQAELLGRLGAEFAVCSPAPFRPRPDDPVLGMLPSFDHLDEALAWCNVVSLLRIQRERITGIEVPSVEAYRERYALTSERLTANPSVIAIHPGPVNANVEIDESLLDHPNVLIHRQVTHGVAVRMVVLKRILGQTHAGKHATQD